MKLVLITLLLSCRIVLAQEKVIVHLWPAEVPFSKTEKKASISKQEKNVLRVTEVSDPVLQFFKAPQSDRPVPVVLVFPGGGYSVLALDKEGYEVAAWLNTIGASAVVVQYRVPNNREGALADAQRAIRIVKSRAREWGIDSQQVGTLGFSAGGSLAARLASRAGDQLYPHADSADRLSARPAFTILIYPAYLDEGPGHSISKDVTVLKKGPPTFIFQTSDDLYGNSALVMAQALRAEQVPVELHFLAKGGHGYGLRRGNEVAAIWPGLVSAWLKHTMQSQRVMQPR